jgi:hypothetical protein
MTLQKTKVYCAVQLPFDARAEISRLYDTIYALQPDIESSVQGSGAKFD